MNMHDAALKEMKEIERNMAAENRKLTALRMIVREYATEDNPSKDRLQMIITECLRKNSGKANFAQLVECMDNHQITMPRNKLSVILNQHPHIAYDKNEKLWKIAENLPNANKI